MSGYPPPPPPTSRPPYPPPQSRPPPPQGPYPPSQGRPPYPPPPPPRDQYSYRPSDYGPPPQPSYYDNPRPPPPSDIYDRSRPPKSSSSSFWKRTKSPESQARKEQEKYYREWEKEMEKREKERLKREKEALRKSSPKKYPWSRQSPSPGDYPPGPPPPIDLPPSSDYPSSSSHYQSDHSLHQNQPHLYSMHQQPNSSSTAVPPIYHHEHHHYLHAGQPESQANQQNQDMQNQIQNIGSNIIDPSRCKLVLMCDSQPVAKLALAKQKKACRRRPHMVAEDYLPPSVLKQHMRPVADLIKAQHMAASNADDLTNQCITITTVCKEIVC